MMMRMRRSNQKEQHINKELENESESKGITIVS